MRKFQFLKVCLALYSTAAFSSQVTIPNEFSNGSVADADAVNANFNAVANGVNALDSRVGALEANGVPVPARVIWVAKSGTDFTTLTAALASITDNSATNRYVIKIAPGVYVEPGVVNMKHFVDVEGAGENATRILCDCSQVISFGAITSELRFLTVRASSTSSPVAVSGITTNGSDSSVSLLQVTSSATGGATRNSGVYNSQSSPSMTSVTASAAGGSGGTCNGVFNQQSSPLMVNVRASASGCNQANGVSNYNNSSPEVINLIATASGGSSVNVGLSNVLNSSPTVFNGRASATGGSIGSYGVYNTQSSAPVIRNMLVSASDASLENTGMFSTSNSSPRMMDTELVATGGSSAYGLRSSASTPELTNVTVSASGATSNSGLTSTSASVATVINSRLTAATNSISNSNDSSAKVGGSMLDGAAIAGGGLTCVGSYSASFVALSSSCQALP